LNKTAAIFFFTVYLFSATEAHQLLKLPVIFQHYAEHKIEDKNISFFRFLDMHYMHGSPKDKDYERDMQLPFKTTGDCISSLVPAFIPLMVQLSATKSVEISENKILVHQDQFTASSYLASIWQPPKFC
jgi:hypothetical protein